MCLTKCDAPRRTDYAASAAAQTSGLTGQGVETLLAAIAQSLDAARCENAAVASTAARCYESLRLAAECLTRGRDLVRTAAGEELVAAELRTALDELGRVVGAVYTDDVLDRVFSRFCIGK